jgi:predicted negative regulator of RcsB-dependent stress response
MSGRIAGEELERVDRSLATGDTQGATQRLGVLLRLDPALAPIILSAADRAASAAAPRSGDLSAIHLVRGDAYRSLGRDIEAAAAYQQAHQALTEGPAPEEST